MSWSTAEALIFKAISLLYIDKDSFLVKKLIEQKLLIQYTHFTKVNMYLP